MGLADSRSDDIPGASYIQAFDDQRCSLMGPALRGSVLKAVVQYFKENNDDELRLDVLGVAAKGELISDKAAFKRLDNNRNRY
ncbi:hypothetical protein NDU88_006209 [Pleurodeles waltl]|uniref:Uncharacterized protein n=1 Tax=Pleurodeles waltl TaxID=8319 RepID=A0AAV7X0M5_PLEWA|nr:hypothetical protein NDU88_006209 [Pleurodeles waltl]